MFLSGLDHGRTGCILCIKEFFIPACEFLKPLIRVHCSMEVPKTRPVTSTVVFSSIFLSVICLSGLIHVEMELHVHRQMLQVLNQQREEKLEQRNTAHEDIQSVVKMSHSDKDKGKESRQQLMKTDHD